MNEEYIRRAKLDAGRIRWSTSMARRLADEAVNAVRDFEADANRDRRLETCECKSCFYLRRPRVGGSAMTPWRCGVCGERQVHGSTATPRACLSCAKEHHLCTYCGGDLDMRERRRKFPVPVEDEQKNRT